MLLKNTISCLISCLVPPALSLKHHAYYLLLLDHLLHIIVRVQEGRNSIKLLSKDEERSSCPFSWLLTTSSQVKRKHVREITCCAQSVSFSVFSLSIAIACRDICMTLLKRGRWCWVWVQRLFYSLFHSKLSLGSVWILAVRSIHCWNTGSSTTKATTISGSLEVKLQITQSKIHWIQVLMNHNDSFIVWHSC